MAVAQGVSAAVPAVSYPGLPATAAGPEMVVWVETQVSQGACAYPITLSTNMGAGYQAAQAAGRKNLWGEPLFFLELESEHSSASTCEGFALAGARWRTSSPSPAPRGASHGSSTPRGDPHRRWSPLRLTAWPTWRRLQEPAGIR
jgi:pyruvate flavodoxin/ferredoxin oxidoreductase-like protein